ncbi:exonuclease, DNA polymerase III, epsilon subunit family [Geoglobus ahangari]|uniref:Exonuclease, DNA polymerase III, epsilon subunit family n=1 Tax=Geoglobus ahangari TaxID=113653 RepID=A0A0F7IHR8_9EURY|nr:3'-5' exonuclease [Geoglobus ahangari]AKG91557.1 exonuclease, DNA polymerase III, epsilon subunit family [Geoglobus ahangari]
MVEGLRDVEFCVIDLETTGLNTKKDEIISFASIPVRDMTIHLDEAFYTLIRPEKFRVDSIKYHGITESDLRDAPTFAEVADRIEEVIDDRVIVGYAVWVDVEFLKNAFKKKLKKKLRVERYVDVAEVEAWLIKKRGSAVTFRLDFESLMKIYRVEGFQRHTALGDAFSTAYVFLKQLSQLEDYSVNVIDLVRIGRRMLF